MDCLFLLNGDSGTLKTTDMDVFETHISNEFSNAGHSVRLIRIDEIGMDEALAKAEHSQADLLIAAGGDGTVSALAELAWKSGRMLGVLPGGTMNLYASTLKMPDDVFDAVSALAQGQEDLADVATANGALFINQYAVGFHPRAVKLRNTMNYGSRIGKIWATLKALLSVMTDPPSLVVEMAMDGQKPQTEEITALSISNNLLGTGHDLFADRYDGHLMGVYRSARVRPVEAVKLILDLIIGTWAGNEKVLIEDARHLSLRFPRKKSNAKALKDGELVDLPDSITFEVHEDALRVCVPQGGGSSNE